MFARLPKQFLDSPCCAPHIVGAAPEEGHLVAGGACQQSEPLSSFSSFSCFIVLSLNQPALCSTPASLGLRLSTSWSIFFQAGFAWAVALSNSLHSSFIFYLTLLCKSPETERCNWVKHWCVLLLPTIISFLRDDVKLHHNRAVKKTPITRSQYIFAFLMFSTEALQISTVFSPETA